MPVVTPNFSILNNAAGSVSSAIANAASSFAMGVTDSIGTGAQVIGSAIDDMGTKATAVLNTTTGKITELGNYLSQDIVGKLQSELSQFTANFGAALHSAPRQMIQFIKNAFSGLGGHLRFDGKLTGFGGLGALATAAHFTGASGRILSGQGVASSLLHRYDNRTGRYHNILTGRMVSMATGRNQAGGLLGNIEARAHELLSNIGKRLMDAFKELGSAVGMILSPIWERIKSTFIVLGKHVLDGVKELGVALAEVFSGIWETVQPFLQVGIKAITGAIKAAAAALPELVIPIITALGIGLIAAIKVVITKVVSAITSAWGAITSFVSNAWTVVVTGVKNFFGFIGNLFNSARGAVGGASGIGSIIAASVKVLLGNMFQLITGALQIGVAGVAMGVFAKAVYEAAKSAQEFAKSALALQSSSGRSFTQSSAIQFGGRVLGISPESLQNAYGGNAAITQMKGRAFGVDPTNLASVAGRFQSLNSGGMGSQMMAQAMLRTLGMDSADFRQALMQRPADIQSQQGYQQGLLSKMGIGDNSLEKFAREVPLLLGRIGAAWDAIKIKLATTALPMIEALGKAITDLAVNNADKIAQGIQTVAEWMFVKAPVMMAQGLVSVSDIVVKAVNWMIEAGRFLEKNLSNVFRMIGETIGRWMDAIGNFLSDAVTNKSNPLRVLAQSIGGFLDFLVGAAKKFEEMLVNLATTPLGMALGLGGAVAGALKPSHDALSLIPKDYYRNTADSMVANNGGVLNGAAGLSHSAADQARNIGDGIAGWLDKTNPFGKGTDFLENTIKPAADAMNEAAIAFQKGVGSEEQRKAQWQNEMLQQAKEQTASLKDLAKQGRAPETSDRTASYMLMRYAKESTVALRRQGA